MIAIFRNQYYPVLITPDLLLQEEGLKIILLLDTSKPLMPWQSGITCEQKELVADQNEFY